MTAGTMPRRRLHRATFVAAGLYNLGWGTLTAVHPSWFFRWAGMEPPRYPEIFACLGMVIGLYGLLYLDVARRPEEGGLIAAVGLTGKLLGPAGFLVVLAGGDWPLDAGWLIVFNDLVWWLPFGLYLWDVARWRRRRGGAREPSPRGG